MEWKIEVFYKPEVVDAIGQGILHDILDLGISGVASVRTAQVYWLEGDLEPQTVERICAELLADVVTQDYTYTTQVDVLPPDSAVAPRQSEAAIIQVRLKPGVTDAVGDSVRKGIQDMGISGLRNAKTGQKYDIRGQLNHNQLESIAQRLLANEVIQTYGIYER